MAVRRRSLVRLAVVVAIAVALTLFVRNLDWTAFGTALADARPLPLVAAAILNFVHLYGMAGAWHVMLAPKHVVTTRRIFRYTIAAFAASTIAPARAGEALRVWALRERDGVPIADGVAVAFGEKLVAAVTLLACAAPVPLLVPGLPSWIAVAMLICAGVMGAAFVTLYVLVGRIEAEEGSRWWRRLIAGMHVIRSPRRLALAAASLVFTWIADLGMVTCVLYAVGIDLPVAAGLLILFTLNIAIMLPSTPASAGTMEVGILLATDALHVDRTLALAFALLYHLLQVIPLVVVGLALELRLVLGKRSTDDR